MPLQLRVLARKPLAHILEVLTSDDKPVSRINEVANTRFRGP